ncbi:hypothetical protein F66182_7182 [Fusarium sp. NRRL 66182]|nr:hypothetical protein F66182_7182 [Fusarium sp. NRRL 66182]
MAPQYLDWESLILPNQRPTRLENCRAFVGSRDAKFEVVTRLDTSDHWYAFILKSEGKRRTKILESQASRPERALEMLHEASARVVDQYVTCHGYELPPRTTSKSPTGMRGGLVKPEVIACGSSDSEAFASDSDESVFPARPSAHRRGQRSGRGAAEATAVRPGWAEAQAASDSDETSGRRVPATLGFTLPQRPVVTQTHKPPPHPWNHPMPVPAPVSMPGVRPAPSVAPPPIRSIPTHSQATGSKTYAALLNIDWPGNGKKNMLVQVTPEVRCLQQIATNEANLRPLGFANSSGPPYCRLPGSGGMNRATVRRVTLGEDETYEMTAFGNDLTALFRSTCTIPKFEIEITTANVNPFPMMPPPRPASAASSASSAGIAD